MIPGHPCMNINKFRFISPEYNIFDKIIRMTADQISFTKKSFLRIAIAASLLGVVLLVFILKKSNYTEISTAVAESRRVELPNGSLVTLNANSSIKYDEDKWSDERRIILDAPEYLVHIL